MSLTPIPLDFPDARVAVVDQKGVMALPLLRLLVDIIRRLGGQRRDYVAAARNTALANQAMLRATMAGVPTGYYHTPSEDQILDFTATSPTTATITIAQHTRSTAAATIQAGSVAGVTRGEAYFVYYNDAGNAGGAVTFFASTSVADVIAVGRKLVGAIYVAEPPPSGGAA